MKEKILEAFENLGFKLKEVDGMGYGFKYEGLNMLYMHNENDEDFLNVSLPGIMDIDESNGLKACVLLEKNQLYPEVCQGIHTWRKCMAVLRA